MNLGSSVILRADMNTPERLSDNKYKPTAKVNYKNRAEAEMSDQLLEDNRYHTVFVQQHISSSEAEPWHKMM